MALSTGANMNENDPAARLREKILSLTYDCPKAQYVSGCPFGILGGLSHATRKVALDRMSYGELERLFELTVDCACPADPRKTR